MEMLRLTKEQDKSLNEMLSKKFGGKVLVTREVADIIKSRLSIEIKKSGKVDAATISKIVEGLRDTLTKTGGKIQKSQ